MKKSNKPRPIGKTVLTYAQSHDCEVTDENTKLLLAQQHIKIDQDSGCALNKDGDLMKVQVATTNLDDMIYASDFYVGNPPQKLTGVFDTGSTNLWVLGSDTKLEGNPEKKLSYNASASTSFVNITRDPVEIFFGSGSLKGYFIKDEFRLGGCDNSSGGVLSIKD